MAVRTFPVDDGRAGELVDKWEIVGLLLLLRGGLSRVRGWRTDDYMYVETVGDESTPICGVRNGRGRSGEWGVGSGEEGKRAVALGGAKVGVCVKGDETRKGRGMRSRPAAIGPRLRRCPVARGHRTPWVLRLPRH